MNTNYSLMTSDQLKAAHKNIEDAIYDAVNNVNSFVTRDMNTTSEAINAEMDKRNLPKWDAPSMKWIARVNPAELKKNVETLAKNEGIKILDAISLLQTGAAAKGEAELLDALCELKWDYIYA
jgi:hypothetical protein